MPAQLDLELVDRVPLPADSRFVLPNGPSGLTIIGPASATTIEDVAKPRATVRHDWGMSWNWLAAGVGDHPVLMDDSGVFSLEDPSAPRRLEVPTLPREALRSAVLFQNTLTTAGVTASGFARSHFRESAESGSFEVVSRNPTEGHWKLGVLAQRLVAMKVLSPWSVTWIDESGFPSGEWVSVSDLVPEGLARGDLVADQLLPLDCGRTLQVMVDARATRRWMLVRGPEPAGAVIRSSVVDAPLSFSVSFPSSRLLVGVLATPRGRELVIYRWRWTPTE